MLIYFCNSNYGTVYNIQEFQNPLFSEPHIYEKLTVYLLYTYYAFTQ